MSAPTTPPTTPPPTAYEIQPQSMAEVLDRGFQLFKNQFRLIGGFALLGQLPTMVFFGKYDWMLDTSAFQGGEFPDIGVDFVIAFGVFLLSMLVLVPYVLGAITSAAGDLYLGAEVSFASVSQRGRDRLIPMVVTYIVFFLLVFVALLVVAIAIGGMAFAVGGLVADSPLASGVMIGIAVLMLLPVFLGLAVMLGFVPGILAAVVMLEEKTLLDAVSRTWELVIGTFWRTMGVAATVYIIVLIAPTGVQFLVGEIPVLGAVIWGAVQGICQAYLFVTAVVVYYDIRCRIEDFDIEHLQQMVEAGPPVAPIR